MLIFFNLMHIASQMLQIGMDCSILFLTINYSSTNIQEFASLTCAHLRVESPCTHVIPCFPILNLGEHIRFSKQLKVNLRWGSKHISQTWQGYDAFWCSIQIPLHYQNLDYSFPYSVVIYFYPYIYKRLSDALFTETIGLNQFIVGSQLC